MFSRNLELQILVESCWNEENQVGAVGYRKLESLLLELSKSVEHPSHGLDTDHRSKSSDLLSFFKASHHSQSPGDTMGVTGMVEHCRNCLFVGLHLSSLGPLISLMLLLRKVSLQPLL